jgi:hypothetical protein
MSQSSNSVNADIFGAAIKWMLRGIAKALFVSRAWIVSIAFLASIAVVVVSFAPFQACTKEQYHRAEAENFEKSISSVSVAFDVYRVCLGHFTHDNAEAVIAAFTILLTLSTIFLWVAARDLVTGTERTAERQLRAYVSVTAIHIDIFGWEKPTAIKIALQNHGQSPAFDDYTVGIADVLPLTLPDIYTLKKFPDEALLRGVFYISIA